MYLPDDCADQSLSLKDYHPMNPDPRVQVELENLNTSTEFINKLELELEKARAEFNNLLNESTAKIEKLSKKLGSSIDKARPYYETRNVANELFGKAQQEAIRYERATSEQEKAKEVVHLTEQSLQDNNSDVKSGDQLLTKSADKVNNAELERLSAEKQHQITSREYFLTEQKLSKLHRELKCSIVKASLETRRNLLDFNNYVNQHQIQLLPYFEMKAQFNQMLEEQVNKIRSYETRVNKAKLNYTKALQRLEELNNEIYDEAKINDNNELTKSLNEDCQASSFKQLSLTEDNITTTTQDSIFDNSTLDKLLLEDEIDSNLKQLETNCYLEIVEKQN